MSDTSKTARMSRLLNAVAPVVLDETWGYYRDALRQDNDGNAKYTGILFYSEGADGVVQEYTIGTLADYSKSFEIVKNKLLCMKNNNIHTSIEGRDPDRSPPFWGGAKTFDDGSCGGITGGTELQDHLLLTVAAMTVGKISYEEYNDITSLQHPGICESIAQFGLDAGIYMAMKVSIEAHFRDADKLLAA